MGNAHQKITSQKEIKTKEENKSRAAVIRKGKSVRI